MNELYLKYPKYCMVELLAVLAPKYIRFRHRYINRITGKIILGEWIDYSKYPTPPKSFGLLNFLWSKRMDFEKEQESCEKFSWNILNR